MLFSELRMGQRFNITSEDDPEVVTTGKIIALSVPQEGAIAVQFDDSVGTYTWGKPNERIHWFMKPVDPLNEVIRLLREIGNEFDALEARMAARDNVPH